MAKINVKRKKVIARLKKRKQRARGRIVYGQLPIGGFGGTENPVGGN